MKKAMILQCYFIVKSAIKQVVASSTEAATCSEEFRCVSILAARDVLCPSLLVQLRCSEFLIRVDKGSTRNKILSYSCYVDHKLKGTAACTPRHQALP